MNRLTAAVAFGFALLVLVWPVLCDTALHADPPKADKDKDKPRRKSWKDLCWDLASRTVAQYSAKPDMKRPAMPGEPKQAESRYSPVQTWEPLHVFGYELGPQGWLVPPHDMDDLAIAIAFWLPNKSFDSSDTFPMEQKFALDTPFAFVGVKGTLTTSLPDPDESKPLTFTGVYALATYTPDPKELKAAATTGTPATLQEGAVRTAVTYDRVKGQISRVQIDVRYSFQEPAALANQPTNTNSRWFSVTLSLDSQLATESKPALQPRIDQAISRGVEALKKAQKPTGEWDYSFKDYTAGAAGLCVLSLLGAGVKRDDPVVVKGLDYLRKHTITFNYNASLICMALEAAATPEDEWKAAREMKVVARPKRDLSPDDRKTMQNAVDFLLKNRIDSPMDVGGGVKSRIWQYPGNAITYDNSNTQYAMLALFAAMRCGAKIPVEIWQECADYFVFAQEPEGPAVVRLMPPKDDTTPQHKSVTPDRARGFNYTLARPGSSNSNAYGSMTVAGIACLAISREGLKQNNRLTKAMKDKIDTSIKDSLAWMQLKYRISGQPGDITRRMAFNYYLYGIERAGVLTGTEWFGDHNWYREGAAVLCLEQGADGRWGTGPANNVDTALALLFLKRATLPVGDPVWTKD